jgi:hypothetical protein
VERTLGWIGRRRLSKDYERKVQKSETLLQVAMIRLMVRRLARSMDDFYNTPQMHSHYQEQSILV